MPNITHEPIEPCQKLFDEMLKRFNISAKDIAEVADISEVMVSRFRNGKADLGASKLFALLFAVPIDAQKWYISELFGFIPDGSLRSLILKAPLTEQAEALRLIADLFLMNNRE
ncbi:hypothetical protein WA1_50145 [Scytonema hofmannii PCC 7110]|uniref:Uncharacterized protein n=1 Tax=Scytonema hofmannii PCC 7110 TaxID=128403 RepID=A0A139WR21_9CYAN|nr:helix-turn-helix transcriptional regulator [Scytonema hofmannii]KYC34890.1 hypothetical protein WA1_50145 [Scytonema hofmannii PCC 7110]